MKLYLTLAEYWVEVIQSKMLVVVARWIFDAIRCKCAFAVPSSHLWCEFIFQISWYFTNFPVFSKILWESYDLFSFLKKRARFFLINSVDINYCKQEPGLSLLMHDKFPLNHTLNLGSSHSGIFALKVRVRRSKWPHRYTILTR